MKRRNGNRFEYNPDLNDDRILSERMPALIRKYPGQQVVVCGGDVFVGRDGVKLVEKAMRLHAGVTPLCSPIPRKQDFLCVL